MELSPNYILGRKKKPAAMSDATVKEGGELFFEEPCSWNELTRLHNNGIKYRRIGFKKWQVDGLSTESQQFLSSQSFNYRLRFLILMIAIVCSSVLINQRIYEPLMTNWHAAEATASNLPIATNIGVWVATVFLTWLVRRPLRSLLDRYLGSQ